MATFGLGDLVLRQGVLVFGLRNSCRAASRRDGSRVPPACRVARSLLQLGLGQPQTGRGLVQLGLMGQVVELGQHVPFLDLGTVVDGLARPVGVGAEALDHAHDLGADVDDLHRFDVPVAVTPIEQIAARDGQRAELRPLAAVACQ